MYKFMEGQLLESRNRLKVKIPDIEASLECIAMLKKKKVCTRTHACVHAYTCACTQARLCADVEGVVLMLVHTSVHFVRVEISPGSDKRALTIAHACMSTCAGG